MQIGGADLVEEADRSSAEAMKSMAWNPAVKSSRASVLIKMGKVDEGIAMAKEVLGQHTEDQARAGTATVLAIGYHVKGDLVEGRKYLDQATLLGCKSRSYRRAVDLYATSVSSQ
jgi:predicted Zn-dependent protease